MADMLEQFIREIMLKRDKVASFDAYPFNLPVIKSLTKIELHPKITYLVGENGSGKSTLLEAIAIAAGFNSEGGSKHFNFNTRESHSVLHNAIRLVRGIKRPRTGFFLRAESFYNVATEIDNLGGEILEAYGFTSLHHQSHGESFMALLNNRFTSEGLYILDEPEAALSPTRQLAALARIHQLVLENSQFIIATHSPILMAYPEAKILQLDEKGINEVSWEETEHYIVTRQFMNKPNEMLDIIFDHNDSKE